MRVLRVCETGDKLEVGSGFLPNREAREKGPADVIPATSFWLARLRTGELPDLAACGAHLMVVLSGEVRVTPRAHDPFLLGPGDIVAADVRSSHAVDYSWPDDAWFMFILTPGWLPVAGDNQARPIHFVDRVGPCSPGFTTTRFIALGAVPLADPDAPNPSNRRVGSVARRFCDAA